MFPRSTHKAKITAKKLYGPNYEGRDLKSYYVMIPAFWAENALAGDHSHVVMEEQGNGQLLVTAVSRNYRNP